MKTPYIKLYTADILALNRFVTTEQLGRALIEVCENAFNNTHLKWSAKTGHERQLFKMLYAWKEESRQAYLACVKAGRKGGKKTQANRTRKKPQIDGSGACTPALSTRSKHTETDTETDTNTETKPYTETEIETEI